MAADPTVELAPIRYKYLEIVKNRELRRFHGNYGAKISLGSNARDLIKLWVHNIDSQSRSLNVTSPQLELFADACLTGWGATIGNFSTGGHWTKEELNHINYLELKAILLGLQSLCKDLKQTHIRIRYHCSSLFRQTREHKT